MRTDPCKKCGNFDFYVKGTFSYCRPCHAEAQRRYKERKATGDSVEIVKPPNKKLSEQDFKSNFERSKIACKNGHLLIGDNVRVSSQRNGRHLFRRCRACERNAKRVAYGLQPEVSSSRLTDLLDN